YNLPLWQRLLAITPAGLQGLGMMLAVGRRIAASFNLARTLLAFRWRLKPALSLLILAAAGTTYVMQTNPAEVADLLSPKLAVYLALLGA
ncbi:phosphoethanolamine transferase, partial [Pseudomonas aeruginosa]